MSIREILASKGTEGVLSISPDSSVVEAINIMTQRNIGSLVVKQGEQMVGLLTDRHIVRALSKAGGNLSEALGNLSRVLRDRKKMKAKIQAMSMEAKASASIIGALPVAVMALVYVSSPQYISLLFTEPLGNLMLAGSATWMAMGVLVMKKMINFDF